MKKIIDTIKNASIFFRMAFIIILTLFLMTVLFFFTTNRYRIEKQNYVYSAVNQSNRQTIDKIDDYIADISNITKIPLTYKQSDATYMNYLSEYNQSGERSLRFQQLNEQIFEEIFTYKKSVNSCFIYNTLGDGDYKVKYAIYDLINPINESWFNDSIEAFGKPVLIDTYEIPNVVSQRNIPLYVFGVSRGIVQLKDAKVIGVLVVNTEVSFFEDLCENMKLTNHHRILILHDDYTIYDTNTSEIAQSAPEELLSIPADTGQQMYAINFNGQKMIASSVSSSSSDWRIISLVPEDELFMEINQIERRNLLVLVFIIALILFILFYATRSIVRPIQRLEKVMKIAESGDFETHIQVPRMDEVGKLSASYNSLLDKINELINEVYVEKITSSELELQMLQSQINPHFLYNTLESISMMATINDDDTTSEMAALLGSILRYSISNMSQKVTLNEEISQLQKYIQLQELRFRSQYRITIDIDPQFYSIVMPKLILQPLVENAIYHGMVSRRSGGQILVTAHKPDRTTLMLIVQDNGDGMDDQRVAELNAYINGENELFKSIGIKNVNRRIQLFCGLPYGLTIKSKKGEGTTVIARILISEK